ncbi:MAG TPA: hypothetical protein DEH78_18995 [Solibacterales bacterium]|nr:hypothetical protein [Bryobacterales bacterium]
MAKTYNRLALGVRSLSDNLSYFALATPEGASQTFKRNWPVVITSGYAVEAANPVTALYGFAGEDAHNAAAGAYTINVYPVTSDLVIEANFLAASAANNVLAAADFGGSFRLAKHADALGTGKAGWYVEDTGSTTAVKIISFRSSHVLPNSEEGEAKAGDTNARIVAKPLAAVVTY